MTNSRGEHMTKALEGTEASQHTTSTIRSEKPEGTDAVYTNSHMRLVEFIACGSGGSHGYGVGLWLKLIPFIIAFDLI